MKLPGATKHILFFALILAGLAGNYFPFSVLNADFIFGSIFVMLALQIFGWRRGVLSAVIIAGYTYFRWNHPWALITMTGEAVVVGLLFRRFKFHLVAADAIYWIFIGIPMGYLCFRIGSDFTAGNAVFLITKQAVNGISNALIARLIFMICALRMKTGWISFREILSNLLLFFLLFPSLSLLFLKGFADMKETDQQIRAMIIQNSRQSAESLENWLEDRTRTIMNLTEMAVVHPTEEMQPHLVQANATDIHFLLIALINSKGMAIAHSPMLDALEHSNIVESFADHPYLPLLKETLKPFLSDVMSSRFGKEEPIAIMMAPVLLNDSYHGAIGGILNFDRLQHILQNSFQDLNILYTLTDRNSRVIITNRDDQKSMNIFSWPEGSLKRIEGGMSQWVPALPSNASTIDLWGKSNYVIESPIGDFAGWSLIIEQPVGPFQKKLYRSYSRSFMLLFFIMTISLVLAEYVARNMIQSVSRLGNLTESAPSKIASDEPLEWFETGIREINRLIASFRVMSDSLRTIFIENRKMNEHLEELVRERTAELHKSEEIKDALISCSPLSIISIDTDGNVLTWNAAAERVFGWIANEVVGKPLPIVDPENREEFAVLKQRAIEGSAVTGMELIRRKKNGEPIHVRISAAPIRNTYASVIGIMAALEDITEHKKAEDAHNKLREQLIQTQKMESIGMLAGGVAHDYNNMLSVIIGYSEMALEKMDPEDTLRSDLEEILSAAMRSSDITRQLLAFSRQQAIAPKVINLNETVANMLKMLRRLIGEDIDLSWHPGDSFWPVYLDPTQLDQILINICVNARDAIAGTGKIIIETDTKTFDQEYCADNEGFLQGDFVVLSLSDNGSGMDRHTQEHLFEPFFTTKQMGKGTGLGLATVYGIVKQHNGFIKVYSEPEQGTTFKIYFSRYNAVPEKERIKDKTEPGLQVNETILLVEDDQNILKVTAMMLEWLGYKVLTADSPNNAIELTGEYYGKIDLLVTDVIMPEMNGRELAMKIQEIYPDIRILYMSGYTAKVISNRALLDKNINFIQKPFSKNDLSVKVRDALNSVRI